MLVMLLRKIPTSIKRQILQLALVRYLRNWLYNRVGFTKVTVRPLGEGPIYVLEIKLADPAQRAQVVRRYEPQVVRYLSRTIQDGDMVVDVGAFIGYYTILMSKLVGPTGRVIAFEPVPDNWGRLVRNVSLNALHNVTAEQLGLSNFTRESDIWLPEEAWQASAVRKRGEKLRVRFVTFDEYIRNNQEATQAVFFKVDVEGSEFEVIQGMENFLKMQKPRLLVEFNDEQDYQRVKAYLDAFGYVDRKIGEESYGFWIEFATE